jgi:hypothetical protein
MCVKVKISSNAAQFDLSFVQEKSKIIIKVKKKKKLSP